MPQSHEKISDSETELPNPELNPLLNPTLGRNLGRWAQVYFTSPPEKREEAVGELLRELQGQPGSASLENSSQHEENQERLRITPVETLPNPSAVQCAECGHRYSSPQRFCGMCGAALIIEEPKKALAAVALDFPQPHEPALASAHDFASMTPVSGTRRTAEDSFSDVRWLREKHLAGETMSSWPTFGPRYAPAALAILAIGILVYAQWLPRGSKPQKTSGVPASNAQKEAQAPAVPATQTVNAPSETPARPTGSATAADTATAPSAAPPVHRETVPAREEEQSVPAQAGSRPADASSGDPQAENVPSAANGSQELAQAEDFLNGRKYPRDSAMAAKFLWKAVGKENPSAVLLLSDMYLTGDGVPKSCDQARLLLTAAARKGVPQAADKLRGVLRSGCR